MLRHLDPGWRGAVALGIHHGLFCCCWALMLMPLVLGVMKLGALVAVGTAIALERLVSRGEAVARAIGVAAVLAGLWVVGQTVTY